MTSGSGRNAFTEDVVTIVPRRSMRCGTAARVHRTAAMKLMSSDQVQSSSDNERNPPGRGRTAPTLLTSTSTPPKAVRAWSTNAPGPSGSVRSTATGRTGYPSATSARSSSVTARAPATTLAPSCTRARVTARPMPLLAPVTTATLPSSPRSMRPSFRSAAARAGRPVWIPWRAQPAGRCGLLHETLDEGQGRVGDVAPAVVDRQRVTAARDLRDLGDALVALLLLVRRVRDGPRDGVVLLAGDDQQGAPVGVLAVHLHLGPRVEVRAGGLEDGRPGCRHGIGLVQLLRLVLADGVGEGVAELFVGQGDRPVAVRRVGQDRGGGLQRRHREGQ